MSKVLTVATAVYKDFPSVWHTLRSLRMHHKADFDILVLDNAPTPAVQTKGVTLAVGGRYVYRPDLAGTARSRDRLFDLARTPWVMVIDAHVLFDLGAIEAAVRYAKDHPVSRDIISGPMVNDAGTGVLTHWRPAEPGVLWGQWDADPRALDPKAPPFEVPSQGLGCFMMRREVWPGFNPNFRGFGGEEGYIHEKVRRLGGRAVCLPALRWGHCFRGPDNVSPFQQMADEMAHNQIVAHRELGIEAVEAIRRHHGKRLTEEEWAKTVEQAERVQPLGLPHPRPKRLKILGVWYTNNAAPGKLLTASLNTIRDAKESSRHDVAVATCVWHPVAGNPFQQVVHKPKVQGHAAILEQVGKIAYQTADVVCFLEHDVLYPPDYFDRVGDAFVNNPDAPVVSNLDYIGLNATGWLKVKDRHEPMHQLAMRAEVAYDNLDRAKKDCERQGWAYLEPQGDRKDWVRLDRLTPMPAVHVNHAHRFTSHGEVCYEAASTLPATIPYWGAYTRWWPGEPEKREAKFQGESKCGQAAARQVPPERETLDKWLEWAKNTPSDFNEHVGLLAELAAEAGHVTEVSGWHKVAIAGLAAGCKGEVRSYALGAKPDWADCRRLLGDRFRSQKIEDSTDCDIEETDLLFLDTKHTAERVYFELLRHHARVRSRIVVHCTETFGERGDDGKDGVMRGLRRFMREHPEWKVKSYHKNNHGLIVVTKDPRDAKDLPPVPSMIREFAAHKLKEFFKGPGIIPLEMAEKRLEVCMTCEERQGMRCTKCGCYLDVMDPEGKDPLVPAKYRGHPGRVFHGWKGCPILKWHPVPPEELKKLTSGTPR